MKKIVFSGTLIAIMMLIMLFSSVRLVHSATPPSIFGVYMITEYAVDGYGSEQWCQGLILQVTDPDGLDNLFIGGEISIRILAPNGYVYPMPTDGLFVTINPEANPPNVVIQWYNESLSYPPVLGSYEITVTDRDSLSTTYITQPTVRVSDKVPTVSYPPNFSIIPETNPTFIWESFSPDTTWYFLEIGFGDGIWHSPHILPDQLSYTYDGPELVRGETYSLNVFVFEDEIVNEFEPAELPAGV